MGITRFVLVVEIMNNKIRPNQVDHNTLCFLTGNERSNEIMNVVSGNNSSILDTVSYFI